LALSLHSGSFHNMMLMTYTMLMRRLSCKLKTVCKSEL
jgi:hypothetical protein